MFYMDTFMFRASSKKEDFITNSIEFTVKEESIAKAIVEAYDEEKIAKISLKKVVNPDENEVLISDFGEKIYQVLQPANYTLSIILEDVVFI